MKSSIYIVGIATVVAVALVSQNGNFDRNIKRLPVNQQLVYSPEQQEASTMQAEVLSDIGTQRDVYFADDIKLGAIGMHDGSLVDDPHDNVFDVYIDKNLQDGRQAYLEYELYGVEDFSSVCRSINDEVSVGGAFVKLSNEWKTQTEKIPSDQLRQGANKVRFSIPSNNEFGYFVKNVRIRFGESVSETRQVVVNQPESRNYYNNAGYVSGYISGTGSKDASVFIGGKPVRLHDGVFEAVVEKSFDSVLGWQTEINVVFADGETIRRNVEFSNPISSDYSNGLEASVPYRVSYASPRMPVSLNLLGFSLQAEVGSVASNVELSVTGLRQQDMPLPSTGMINVTASSDGYRCLPHGNLFSNDVKVHVKYDTARIPKGYGPKDIRTFYYDDVQQDWVMLPLDSVDIENCEIISTTNHFTDFIDGILKTPESPQTQAFTPTSMKDMKFADPMEGVNMMSPPSVNNNGTANMSYPIQVPAGRQGMQPQLAISYNSEGGNGFLGVGWGLNTPSISVETRWGVPRYSNSVESEEYLVNGQQIVELDGTDRLPLVHMAAFRNRGTASETEYSYRVEGAFDKIIRHGKYPKDYWWEVVDKQGTHYYYGKYSTDTEVNPNCVLMDTVSGNIAHWALAEVRDMYGNYMKYSYQTIIHNSSPGTGGRQLYLTNIVYTGFQTTDGLYNVDFVYDGGLRDDYMISGRYGFLQVTDKLLSRIEVTYDKQFVKAYELKYKEGAYGKNLICAIADISDITAIGKIDKYPCGEINDINLPGLKIHGFEYYNDSEQSFGNVQNLLNEADENEVSLMGNLFSLEEISSLGSSVSAGGSLGGSINLGLGTNASSKSFSIGASLTKDWSGAFDLVAFTDINGDNLPDRIYKFGNGIYYKKMILLDSTYCFNSSFVAVSGLSRIGKSSSNGLSWGLEAQFGIGALGIAASYGETTTRNYTSSYFADVNADGYPDYIDEGILYYNNPDTNGNPVFTRESTSEIQYIGGDTCNFIIRTGVVNDSVYTDEGKVDFTYQYTRDGVRIWIAPYSGTVLIDNNIQLIEDTSYSRSQSTLANGVRYVVQKNATELFQQRIYASDYANHQWDSILSVTKGDRIYFRLQSMVDRSYDNVVWNPVITYTEISTSAVDADDKKIGVFEPEEDLLINNKQIFQAPYSGQIMLRGTMSSSALSDSLFFRIMKGNTVFDSATFADNSTINYTVNSSMNVNEGDSIIFEAYTSTNVNWNDIDYDFKLFYYHADSVTIDTTSVYSRIEVKPMVQFHVFNDTKRRSSPIPLASGTYSMVPVVTASTSVNDTLIWAIKSNGNLLAKTNIILVNGVVIGSPSITFISPGGNIFFEFYTDNYTAAANISNVRVQRKKTSILYQAGLHTIYPDSMIKFGNLYRGWGQFTYFDQTDTTSIPAIDENKLHLSQLYRDTTLIGLDASDTIGFSNPATMENFLSYNGLNNHAKEPFAMMYPDLDSMVWRDYAWECYTGKSAMGNNTVLSSFSDTIYDSPIVVNNDPNVVVRAVRKLSLQNNQAWSVSASYSAAGSYNLSYAHNNTSSTSMMEYMDINGDRYPDIVGSRYVQYSTPQGGISNNVSNFDGDLNAGVAVGRGYTFGVNLPIYIPSSRANNVPLDPGYPKVVKSSRKASASGTYYNGTSNSNCALIDMNGDALPDRVSKSTGKVALNKGYSFGDFESWNVEEISEDKNYSLSFSGGSQPAQTLMNIINNGLFNQAEFSWSGGVGLSLSKNEREWGTQDMNNDGLIDIIHFNSASDEIEVYINSGHGYGSSTTDWSNASYPNAGNAIGASAYLSGSLGFPIFFIKVVFNLQAGASGSLNVDIINLSDINNDGYLDIVFVNELTQQVNVRYSNLGKINLLKKVSTPTAAQYIVDYTLNDCSQEMPSRQWNMTSLKVFDGFVGDGQDTTFQKFEYAGGYYDRFERTFNGYNIVKTMQYDHFGATGICYRSSTEYFHNDNYLLKGLKYYDVIQNSAEEKFVETYYHWSRLEIETGDSVTAGQELCFGPYYPGLSQEDKYFYEEHANYQIHTRKTYSHGAYGNVKQYVNYADMADNTDDIRADILYNYNLANHLLAMVTQMGVYDYQSNILRKKTASYNSEGRLINIASFDGSNSANVDLEYDCYGNIIHIEYPENVTSDRLEYIYGYDSVVHTYTTSVMDYWGNTSSTTYDYRLGVPLLMTDICNNQMEFTYYSDGKPKSVKGPKEMGSPNETIVFEYWDESGGGSSANLWVKTRHFDPLSGENEFVTVNFSDGLGRSIQSKQKATISGVDRMVVSGNVAYDEFGRAVSVSLPTYQALGTDTVLFIFTPSNFATTVFDVLDRPLEQKAPDSTTVQYDYDFGQDDFGKTCFKTKIADPNGISTTKYTDARGLTTLVFAPLHTKTSFQYSPLGELLISTDPENNQTSYIYDMMGRLVSRNHPDAGTTSYTYDMAGNVLTTQTENLAGNSQHIEYSYDDCRLEFIIYPQNPEMNVYYEYGAPSSGNQSGRLVKQQDASGVQTFEYGNMGELIKNIHTFVVPNGNAYTLETDWEYDSWNRMKNITYPDGEVVSYHYNNGGQLIALDGVKGVQSFSYIDNVEYNLYGSREQIDYGNGTFAEYTYDPLNQRLTRMTSYENSDSIMQSIDYYYDKASNIIGIENLADVVGDSTLGGNYSYEYIYDELYRLTYSEGNFYSANYGNLGFDVSMEYSSSGNITNKSVSAMTEIGGSLQNVNYSNDYQYNTNQPHTVFQTDANTYSWDANGNMTYRTDNNNSSWRHLCWDEENRLTAVRSLAEEQNNLSSYVYNAGGERTWKLTGDVMNMYINGQGYVDGVEFEKTLYVNPYMVISEEGYTKHFYIEGERVCSKIGGSGWVGPTGPNSPPLGFIVNDDSSTAKSLWDMVARGVECSEFNPDNVVISPTLNTFHIRYTFPETDLYFYHSDHLGSSSFITDATGYATQHLQYLPFGETFVDQQNGYDSRYTFSAKEKDDETQYSYFGARYYDSDLSVWLSVDAMAGKYAGVSPYAYCLNNPIYYFDPDGNDGWVAIEATYGSETGHTVMVCDNYVYDKEKGMYYRSGYRYYENHSSPGEKILNGLVDQDLINKRITEADGIVKVYETGNGQVIDGVEYYTKEQVETEQNVFKKSQEIKENKKILVNGKMVSANEEWEMEQYSCADYVSELLAVFGYSKDIGNTIFTAYNGKNTYTKKTPNQVFLDIVGTGRKPEFMSWKITTENAQMYLQDYEEYLNSRNQ